MISNKTTIPELLAPAGSIEAFHAAVDAGADAIYCGLDDFNARLRAKNFSIKALSHLIPFAHELKRKVYVTLNTLIKTNEIERVLHTLYQLQQLKTDAVIIADPGLIALSHEHFPDLKLHGSTQMTFHNLPGVSVARQLGLSRIVLSRELTASEITSISRQSSLELEVFIHGALCYSISGLCLASSFFGGSSGNRGRCTQVCRRKFTFNKTEAYSFSPDDLCAAEFVSFLSKSNIASFKIEGRMKSAEYVYKVVCAYRKLLDKTSDISLVRDELENDFGRPKTSFFLKSRDTRGLIKAARPSGTGAYLGKVLAIDNNNIRIGTPVQLNTGDRIRIQPVNGFDGVSATIRSCKQIDDYIVCIVNTMPECTVGDTVYHTGTKVSHLQKLPKETATQPVRFHQFYHKARSIIQQRSKTTETKSPARPQLWCKIDSTDWMSPLLSSPCQHLLTALEYQDFEKLLTTEELFKPWRSRIVPCLPPFIPPEDIKKWSSLISEFQKQAITTWCCSNIGQRSLFTKKCTLIADTSIPVLNSFTWHTLQTLGFSMFSYSLEDDYLNLRNNIHQNGILCLYSHVPLFISRIRPAARLNTRIQDPYSNSMYSYLKNDLYYTSSEKPLCLTGKKNKLIEEGILHFSIDLSGMQVDLETLREILNCYKASEKVPDSTLFNFKAGLK